MPGKKGIIDTYADWLAAQGTVAPSTVEKYRAALTGLRRDLGS